MATPTDYKGCVGSGGERNGGCSPEDYRRRTKDKFANMVQATGLVRNPMTWREFTNWMYLKMSGGSSSLTEKLTAADIGMVHGLGDLKDSKSGRLAGNKRLQAEIDEFQHFAEFADWLITAFLKYEPAANRWLYPASFKYVKLGLYIMDSIIDAFNAISGVDLGHDLMGSVATKLDVLDRVSRGLGCLNTDGENFNGHHTKNDMWMMYDMIATVVKSNEGIPEAFRDTMEAIEKYKTSLNERTIVIPKFSGTSEEAVIKVHHTLFSGEGPTQFVNTGEIGGIAMEGTDSSK
jgi:hypothetical protein